VEEKEMKMPDTSLSEQIRSYYDAGQEEGRLLAGGGQLELVRTQEIILRSLPTPPATVYDVGGGAGIYALWLAQLGYEVHLVDPVPLHIEQVRAAVQAQPDHPLASYAVGDARALDWEDASADAVLLLGPLYHLTERAERVTALREAARVLRPGGRVYAAAISRFASALDGVWSGHLDHAEFRRIVERDLAEGQHRNPTDRLSWFTTAYFHHPEELRAEVEEAGLICEATLAVEGPLCLLQDLEERWADDGKREQILQACRWLEADPAVLGVTGHLLAVGRRV
jgi:ubiquinone/menaquinone biosynthesis C-methylase UbiE